MKLCDGEAFSMVRFARELPRILQKAHLLTARGDQRSHTSDLQASPCQDWRTDGQISSREAQRGKPEALA